MGPCALSGPLYRNVAGRHGAFVGSLSPRNRPTFVVSVAVNGVSVRKNFETIMLSADLGLGVLTALPAGLPACVTGGVCPAANDVAEPIANAAMTMSRI